MNKSILEKIQETINYIEEHLDDNISYSDISKISFMSKSSFYSIFSSVTGCNLKEYIRKRRLSLSAAELVFNNFSIMDIAFKYCYNSYEAYSRAFKSLYGIPPKKYRSTGIYIDIFPRISINIKNYTGGIVMNCREMNYDKLVYDLSDAKEGYILDIDIDKFKKVNDDFGRDFGDRVLVTIPDRVNVVLTNNNIETDVVRISSDEFAVVLKNISREKTIDISESIIQALKTPISLKDISTVVSVSIGILPLNISTLPAESITNVRKAMKNAKDNGRNQYFEVLNQ